MVSHPIKSGDRIAMAGSRSMRGTVWRVEAQDVIVTWDGTGRFGRVQKEDIEHVKIKRRANNHQRITTN